MLKKANGMLGKPTTKETAVKKGEVVCAKCEAKIDLDNFIFGEKIVCPKCKTEFN